ncbi:hypothetical protein [Tissierella sp.]|uniref:hypothetical protein n=1 Tax=Tissierella sp. TaxID=41274 RepID=UPI00285EE491|nr:hypothetical protein [Tissierella sp.]MDR7856114.1 hypothetical protein [Tissierella sp.]
MGARSTRNRHKDNCFMSKDIETTIKKAKTYHSGEREFYIFRIKSSNDNDTFYADGTKLFNKNPIKHFINTSKYGDRSKWLEVAVE